MPRSRATSLACACSVTGADVQPGRFITLEGIEGVGKSTNLAFVADWLRRRGLAVVVTREPGGTPLAEKIRGLLLDSDAGSVPDAAELLLMFAARASHLAGLIEPALARGDWVICDRFTDATYAYQGGGRGLPEAWIADLERRIQGSRRPDLTLLLDASPQLTLSRRAARGISDRFERETEAFFGRVADAYRRRAAREPGRIRRIDASSALHQVQAELAEVLRQYLESLEINTIND